MRCLVVIVAFVLLAGQMSFAQQVFQQPIVGETSVNTTVSVPDRGRVFLGGVSSAQSGRSQYGPLRSGTSSGLTRQSTSISTSVYIHDLQAMDEELLNSVPPRSYPNSSQNQLFAGSVSQKPLPTVPEPGSSPAIKAAKFEQLARKANDSGKTELAKLHWQMAAKYGSEEAKKRLQQLTRQ